MFVASFATGAWQANCYLLGAGPGAECVVVDPGLDAFGAVAETVERHHLVPVGVLLTHGHIDHVASAAQVASQWDVPAWIHADDRELLTNPAAGLDAVMAGMLGQLLGPVSLSEPADLRLFENAIELAGLPFDVIHAPGHRPGCVMLRTPLADHDEYTSLVLTGDVVFAGSIGRTDLPGGDHAAMLETLRGPVLGLDDASALLPGHGRRSVMAAERGRNPYLQADYLGSAAAR